MLLDLLTEYKEKGWNVPKIMFLTNTQSAQNVVWLYNKIYSKNLYKDLWFYGPYKKPLITVGGDELAAGIIPNDMLEFFHVRPSQWPGFEYQFYENGFSWCDLNRPQRIHEDMINVCVAQHNAYIFSYGKKIDPKVTPRGINYGRGYTSETKRNGDVNLILAGGNIQEHWDFAIKQNPAIVFVTGWNEWATNKRHAFFEGQTVAAFVDSFNTEFSRDMEMTKSPTYVIDEKTGEYIEEGYGDNYYLQLIQNIRRYKGIEGKETEQVHEYHNPAVNKERNFGMYKQDKAVNFIKKISVTNDDLFICFNIETDAKISDTDVNKTNRMNIFIGTDGTGWETFKFVINRHPLSENKTSLEVFNNGLFEIKEYIDYTIKDNVMSVFVPIKDLDIKENMSTIRFKCSDSIEKESDILDYYVSGCSVPIGRLSYVYSI